VNLKLTKYGECARPGCGRDLFLELAIYPSDPLCEGCTGTRLLASRWDGGRVYQFTNGWLLDYDGAGRCLRFELVPFAL